MTDVLARAEEIATVLRDAGLVATTDPAKVDAGFNQDKGTAVILVECLPQYVAATLCQEWVLTWRLVALAPRDGGKIPAARLVKAVEVALEALPIGAAVPGSYPLEEGQAPYPAYIMTMED